ncbi:DNA topoisomerase 3-alpha [Frankliniella fusca]|uniref:DNA topoisomerase 3-alpha n=1 Tax=Frankliniella fusca TaxID=407009 RepID=A0AAE1LRU9_9NEOP|nr:DNA topoisomerase 3-alpha [Frankliniella fusca]
MCLTVGFRNGPSTGPSGGRPTTTAPAIFQNRGSSAPADNSIVCKCNTDAIQLTVRKDGPNQGRPFYRCGNNGSCDFFMWADESNHPEPNSTRNQGPSRQTTFSDFSDFNNAADGSEEVTCQCGQPARRCTVQKDGPNKGREFHTCPKPRDSQCQFFQWVDGPQGGGRGRGGFGRGAPGRGAPGRGGSGRGGSNTNSKWSGGGAGGSGRGGNRTAGGGTKRKCGACGQEGHTRPKCPNT